MPDIAAIKIRIGRIFEEKLHLLVPSSDTDLFATGSLDSLSFVDLLVEIERDYGLKIDLEDLELKNFQSIDDISEFITRHLATQDGRSGVCGQSGSDAGQHQTDFY